MERVQLDDCMHDQPSLEQRLAHFNTELASYGKAMQRLKDFTGKQEQATTKLQTNNDNLHDELLKIITLLQGIEIGSGDDDSEQSMRGIFGLVLTMAESHKDAQEMLIMSLQDRIETLQRHHDAYCVRGKELHKERKARRDRYFKNLDKQLAASKRSDLDLASLFSDQRGLQQAYLNYVCHINQWLDRKSQLIGEQLLLYVKSLEVFHRSCAESCQQVLNRTAELSEASHDIIAKADKAHRNRVARATELMGLAQDSFDGQSSSATAHQRPLGRRVGRKEGWLYIFRKGLVGASWVRVYAGYDRKRKVLHITGTDATALEEAFTVDACVQRFSDDVDRKFVFEITSSEGKSILLQALNDRDRQSWMSAMQGLAPTKTIRRKAKTKEKIIGLTPSGVAFLQRAMAYIEREGIDEQGIYRVPGQKSKIHKLFTDAIERGKPVNLQDVGISTCASTLKHYLREMQPPLLTDQLCDEFAMAAGEPEEHVVMALKRATQSLPGNHYQVAAMLFAHLHKIAQHSDTNSMSPSNLGTCFGPSILRRPPEQTDQAQAVKDMKAFNLATELMIKHAGQIFGFEESRPDSETSATLVNPLASALAQPSTQPSVNSKTAESLYANLVEDDEEDEIDDAELPLPPPATTNTPATAQSFARGPAPQPPPRKRSESVQVPLQGRTVRALYDCVGDEEDELSFAEGDLITGVMDEEENWLFGTHVKTAAEGLFPESYVTDWTSNA
eukprot:TRINITY_DN7734_c0_g1_i1.p1 TRINITY_DN7734_c0_g1~~TRINITY_DN7734_c0_g1_i1.p1  ORF type:complete len:730 (+),score=179.39 TRINITY_DN7734_c0_g1_i1:154-2343(+)